jgi:hypothetical protein
MIFTRERIDHKDDRWLVERLAEDNPAPDWRVFSDHDFSPDILRLVEERCGSNRG